MLAEKGNIQQTIIGTVLNIAANIAHYILIIRAEAYLI
jgi:hypothetical protein